MTTDAWDIKNNYNWQKHKISPQCGQKLEIKKSVNILWDHEKLLPCPFTGHKMFCVGPNVLCRTKNLFTYCASHILCQTKRWFAFSKIGFCAGTKVFEEALNAVKFLGWLKKFGPAQNILGPVKGQGISEF